LLMYFLIDFEMISIAPIITGITLVILLLLLLLLLLLFTASKFSLGGSSPCTSTDKINKNKYT